MNRTSTRKLFFDRFEKPATGVLNAMGVSPNALTILTLPVSVISAYLASIEALAASGIVLLIAGLLDMLDGALARATERETAFGALLDSTSDRISEALILIGVLIFYMGRPDGEERVAGAVLVFTAVVGSSMVSYVRARAEGLALNCKVGVMTRPERIVALASGLILGQWWELALLAALAVISVLTAITTVQRVLHVRNLLSQRQTTLDTRQDPP